MEVYSPDAPAPGGHYAQAIRYGDMLFVSGQLGVTAAMVNRESIPIADQVEYALLNIERIARQVGSDRNAVLKCTIYIVDILSWDEVNRAYANFFGTHRPARAVVPCQALHFGAKVEVEAIIAVNDQILDLDPPMT